MAGVVIPVFCLRTWDFSGLQTSTAEEFCILRDQPVEQYREASLMVRIHSSTIDHASSKIEVRVVAQAPTPEDPSLDFEGLELALGRVIGSATPPTLIQNDFTTPFGGFVTVYVKGTQGSAGTSVIAGLSAEIVLKE